MIKTWNNTGVSISEFMYFPHKLNNSEGHSLLIYLGRGRGLWQLSFPWLWVTFGELNFPPVSLGQLGRAEHILFKGWLPSHCDKVSHDPIAVCGCTILAHSSVRRLTEAGAKWNGGGGWREEERRNWQHRKLSLIHMQSWKEGSGLNH